MEISKESLLGKLRFVWGVIGAVAMLNATLVFSGEISTRPTVGAIRWDAWTGGGVTAEVERSLGPAKYHDRLPWFAKVEGDGRVWIDGSPQQVMDEEIEFAAGAGLDYWAFLLYPEDSSMSRSLKNYLNSGKRNKIKFCLILHNSLTVSEKDWPRERERAVALLKERGYQTVLNNRPLVFAFWDNFPAQRFAEFRRAAQAANLNPYYVYMGWNPSADFKIASAHGFDAVSAYAYGSAQKTFAELCDSVEKNYWQNALSAKVPYVPLVTTGWDKRPRKDNPVSWERNHAYHQQTVFPSRATPEEIASHLKRALNFVKTNPDICVANTIIIYAWNEHDEGGWLEPTWTTDGKPDTSRLDAIRKVLKGNDNHAR